MITIIGGGITGLSAAYELAERGVPFRLIEAAPRLGGLIFTEHVDGFTIEAGPDSMLVQKPAALQLCDQLGLGPRLISTTPPRTAFILKQGRLHALPSPSILGIPLTWRGLAEYRSAAVAVAAAARDGTVRAAASRSRRRIPSPPSSGGGSAARRRSHRRPAARRHSRGSIESLSMRSLFPRLVETERRGSVVLGFRRTHSSSATDGPFKSLSSGMSEMVTAIEHRLPAGSVSVRTPATLLHARKTAGASRPTIRRSRPAR